MSNITGYRTLSENEIQSINYVKSIGSDIESLVNQLKMLPDVDQRWISIGVTQLQQGLMALTRAVAKPTTF
jgi:hypothetical protein